MDCLSLFQSLENDDARLHGVSKNQIEVPPLVTSAKAGDGREVCF